MKIVRLLRRWLNQQFFTVAFFFIIIQISLSRRVRNTTKSRLFLDSTILSRVFLTEARYACQNTVF